MSALKAKFASGGVLVVSSLLASIANMYSFLLVPIAWPTGQLGVFIEHNYLGGSYMALVASSVMPISIFLLNNGGMKSFRSYLLISILICLVVIIAGAKITIFPYSSYGVAAALLLHFQGIALALMIKQERTKIAAICILVQPFIFAVLLTCVSLYLPSKVPWIYCWFAASAVSGIFFLSFADWRYFLSLLKSRQSKDISFKNLISRILVACSFPVYFQLELILVGNYSDVDLTEFGILQKLYVSIVISLFANLSALLIAKDLISNSKLSTLPDIRAFAMALCSMLVVIIAGSLFIFGDKAGRFDMADIFSAGFVASLFTVSAFMNLRQIQVSPIVAGVATLFATFIYVGLFFKLTPDSAVDLMLLAGGFFMSYILISLVLEPWQRRGVKFTESLLRK